MILKTEKNTQKNKKPPLINFPEKTPYHFEAEEYVNKHFDTHYGHLSSSIVYPVEFESSQAWLEEFLEKRFKEFGDYEDAIVQKEVFFES